MLRAAELHLLLGETALGRDEDPSTAKWHFRKVLGLTRAADPLAGLARYDLSVIDARQGAYKKAHDGFLKLLGDRGARGYDSARAAMWLRTLSAREGEREHLRSIGIVQPDQLDPKCGLQSLATVLKTVGGKAVTDLDKHCRVTGFGSSMEDLRKAAVSSGFDALPITATESGFRALPKPVVAFVQGDHFVTVLDSDHVGVTYVCSECGPENRMSLTWEQWRAMRPSAYLAISREASDESLALQAALDTERSSASATRLMVHSRAPLGRSTRSSKVATLAARLSRRVHRVYGATTLQCGGFPHPTLRPTPVAERPSDGDPVDLTTGEEVYAPSPDLVVYNPKGPDVVWARRYTTLTDRGESSNSGYLGERWSTSYDLYVYDPSLRPITQIVRGTAVALSAEGTEAPAAGLTWDILKDGTSVATSLVPNGWTVQGVNNGYCTVTPPTTQARATGFKIRWADTWYSNNASFDVLAPQEARQDWKSQFTLNGTEFPAASTVGWDITLNGTVVSTSDAPNGWVVGGVYNQPSLVTITVPTAATTSTLYKYRSRNSFNIGSSTTFTVLAGRSQLSTGPKQLVLFNGARISITPSAVPTSTNPTVACAVQSGLRLAATWNYDSANPQGYYVVTQGNGTKFTFRPWNRSEGAKYVNYAITRETDRCGSWIGFNYTSMPGGNFWLPYLTSIVDSTGAALLTFNKVSGNSGFLDSVSDRYGRSVYYTYGSYATLGSVSEVVATGTTNPPIAESFGYWQSTYPDRPALISSITKRSPSGSGTVTQTFEYDTVKGVVTKQTDPNGNYRQLSETGPNTTTVSVKDPLGNLASTYTTHFDGRLNPTGYTDGSNSTIVVSKVYGDPNNPDRPTQISDANGVSSQFTYDQFGNVLTMTTPRGTVTTYTYDYSAFSLGRLMSVQVGSKPATTYTYYEPSGLVKTVTAPTAAGTSGTTTYTYDSLGNVLTATEPGNAVALTNKTTFNYTTDGTYTQTAAKRQPVTIKSQLGYVQHLRYDAQGRLLSNTDPLGNMHDATYNLTGQVVSSSMPATGQTGSGRGYVEYVYAYPGGPNLATKVFDESGSLHRLSSRSYGPNGELLGTSGNQQSTSYAYDADYRIKAFTDGKNQTTSYSYNSTGYLASISYPGGGTTTFDSYDFVGNLLQRTNPRGIVTTYTYGDAAKALTAVQSASAPSLNVSYGYDGYGRLTSKTDGTGAYAFTYGDADELLSRTVTYTSLPVQTIGYSYNPDGTRLGMTTPGGNFGYTYDGNGRLTKVVNPNSEQTTWSYLNNGWLWKSTSANALLATRTYDALGRVTTLANTRSTTSISQFSGISRNAAGLITSVTASIPALPAYGGTTNYGYDASDRLTSEVSSRTGSYSAAFVYDGAGNPTTFKGAARSYDSGNRLVATGFSYDNDGNPTTYNGQAATYDVDDRLTSISGATYGYNAEGLRAWKQVSGTRTYFLYDGEKPVCELDSLGNVTATNTFGANGLVSRRSGLSTVFYAYDHAGGTAERMDSAGVILSHHVQDAYGVTLSNVATTDPFRGFGSQAGYRIDDETGFFLLGRRYYDPGAGRFVTRDPIGLAGGSNLYSYCGGDPVNMLDPSGLQQNFNQAFGDALGGKPNEFYTAPAKPIVDTYSSATNSIGKATMDGLGRTIDNVASWGPSAWTTARWAVGGESPNVDYPFCHPSSKALHNATPGQEIDDRIRAAGYFADQPGVTIPNKVLRGPSTIRAALNLPQLWNGANVQTGAYTVTATNRGTYVEVTATNDITWTSAAYHYHKYPTLTNIIAGPIPMMIPEKWESGPMSTVRQTYHWRVPVPPK